MKPKLPASTGLNESGYQTTQVGNGLHALSVLEQQQIDLVLLDVMLPDLDGWQVLKTLRTFLKFPYYADCQRSCA